jgi:hypothetical protein
MRVPATTDPHATCREFVADQRGRQLIDHLNSAHCDATASQIRVSRLGREDFQAAHARPRSASPPSEDDAED